MLPHVIVINLDRDVERMAHMRRQLDEAGLPFQRFAAIQGDKLLPDLSAYFEGCRTLSRGEIGCYASHLRICTMMVQGRLPSPLLVLEDDIAFESGFTGTFRALLTALPSNWDIVRLSYPTKRSTLRVAPLGARYDLVRYSHVPTSTGAYLLSQAGARKFLATRKRELPVDQDLRRVWAWGLQTYGISPPPVRNDCFGASTIDTYSPGGRETPARTTWMKAKRWLEAPRRQVHGFREFGPARWMALEAVNLLGRFTPRRRRSQLYAWASARLAQTARGSTA